MNFKLHFLWNLLLLFKEALWEVSRFHRAPPHEMKLASLSRMFQLRFDQTPITSMQRSQRNTQVFFPLKCGFFNKVIFVYR